MLSYANFRISRLEVWLFLLFHVMNNVRSSKFFLCALGLCLVGLVVRQSDQIRPDSKDCLRIGGYRHFAHDSKRHEIIPSQELTSSQTRCCFTLETPDQPTANAPQIDILA